MTRIKLIVVALLCLAACSAETGDPGQPLSGLTFIHLNDTYRIGAVESGTRGWIRKSRHGRAGATTAGSRRPYIARR